MAFSIGIIGLPNVGKSTLFKILTKKEVKIDSYPFTTIDPNVGKVAIPDKRLEKLAKIIKPEKVTPPFLEFIDIAGLVKGAHKGEGLGNQFLSHIRECDAIVEIVRAFKRKDVQHVEGEIDPKRDIEIIETELLMKDLEQTERALEKYKKIKEEQERVIFLEKIKDSLSKGIPLRNLSFQEKEKKFLKEYNFLTYKPILHLLNTDEENFQKDKFFKINLKLEEELLSLSEKEKEELKLESKIDLLILESYNILNLLTFYTIEKLKEIRGYLLKKGENDILKGAEKVHSDFKEKFKRAEVISFDKFIQNPSLLKLKEEGEIKIVGKDYLIKDGDIIKFII